jgi:hypothetical protein
VTLLVMFYCRTDWIPVNPLSSGPEKIVSDDKRIRAMALEYLKSKGVEVPEESEEKKAA